MFFLNMKKSLTGTPLYIHVRIGQVQVKRKVYPWPTALCLLRVMSNKAFNMFNKNW